MLGAIIGDIAGSRFEFDNYRKKDFELFTDNCFVTDDSIITLCLAKAVMETVKTRKVNIINGVYDEHFYSLLEELSVKYMQKIGRNYPSCGYGGRFFNWIFTNNPKPYNSYGNGAAMRVSPVAYIARNEDEVVKLSVTVTGITHNHKEGLKGAQATALCIYMALIRKTKDQMQKFISSNYYNLNFTIDEIRNTYSFNETCQDTVPQAIKAFLESESFEDAIRVAVSVGGDSDTLAAITGSIAGAFYTVPADIEKKALSYLDSEMFLIYKEWEEFRKQHIQEI